MLQSCDKSEELSSLSDKKTTLKKLEYLDADTSNLANPTEQQQKIIKKAMARIDSFVICENKTFRFTINSGSEIQISERLFEFFKSKMLLSNSIVKNLNVTAVSNDPTRLRVIPKAQLNKKVRLKFDIFETYEPIPDGQSGYDVRWYGYDVYLNNELAKQITVLLAGGCAAAAIVTALGGNVPAAIASAIMGYGSAVIGTYNEGKGVVIEVVPGFDCDIRSR